MLRRILRWLAHADAPQYGEIPTRTHADMLRDLAQPNAKDHLPALTPKYRVTQPAKPWKLRVSPWQAAADRILRRTA